MAAGVNGAVINSEIQFRKLPDGKWGIIGPYDAIADAIEMKATVIVHRKDGKRRKELPTSIVERIADKALARFEIGKGEDVDKEDITNKTAARRHAIKILEFLSENRGTRFPTNRILEELKVARTTGTHILKILHKLADNDVIFRVGSDKYRWAIKNDNWHPEDPFNTGDRKPIPPARRIDLDEDDEPEEKEEDDPAYTWTGSVADERLKYLEAKINALEMTNTEFAKRVLQLQGEIEAQVKTIKIELPNNKVIELDDVVLPKVFEEVLDLAKCRCNILLVGPAGCGKTHIGKLVADSLDLQFGTVSCTAGMTEAHLLGKSIPDLTHGTTKFVGTEFLDCYENGGVFLLDELDAADPNMMLALNSAIANGYCNVPARSKKPQAEKHKDFIIIATANTFGRGANRTYAGRNALDEATLDRFRIGMVECDYDEGVERALCPDSDLREKLWDIRRQIEVAGLRRIMSTRYMQDAYKMHKAAKWSIPRIVNRFFNGWSADERAKVTT